MAHGTFGQLRKATIPVEWVMQAVIIYRDQKVKKLIPQREDIDSSKADSWTFLFSGGKNR